MLCGVMLRGRHRAVLLPRRWLGWAEEEDGVVGRGGRARSNAQIEEMKGAGGVRRGRGFAGEGMA